MIRDRRRLRRATTLIAGVVLIVGVDVALLRTASAKTDFEVLNGTINAGADSVVYYNGAFPNWAAGVVSNTYPLAHGHIDNSPFAEATSTPADTGPLGGTATGAWNSSSPPPPILLAQPQYASAKYPPGSKKPSTVGSDRKSTRL